MKKNKHGFELKQEFTMGGIAWTVIQTGANWVKCITSECVEEGAFDEENENDFVVSSLRAYLNGEFLRRLIAAGAPEEMFKYFNIDLTADDGLKNYGFDRVRIGLITCEEYRLLRGNISMPLNRWWWTATPSSPINSFVRIVHSNGTLGNGFAYYGTYGVRPLCVLKSEILKSYLSGENAEEQAARSVKRKELFNMNWKNFLEWIRSYNPIDWDNLNNEYVFSVRNGYRLYQDFEAKYDETRKQMDNAVAKYKIEKLQAEIRRLNGED